MDIADVWRMSSVLKTAFLPKKLVKVQKKIVPLHQQKKGIKRKGQRRIGRASHGCLSIVIEGQHPRCLWCSIFVSRLS